jgi:hypothetical protein
MPRKGLQASLFRTCEHVLYRYGRPAGVAALRNSCEQDYAKTVTSVRVAGAFRGRTPPPSLHAGRSITYAGGILGAGEALAIKHRTVRRQPPVECERFGSICPCRMGVVGEADR